MELRSATSWGFLILSLVCILGLGFMALVGCEETFTEKEWEGRYVPKDVNEAVSIATLRNSLKKAEAEVASMERLDKFKIACAAGMVAGVVGMVIGAGLRIKWIILVGAAAFTGCLVGVGLAYAGSEHGGWIGLVGLLAGLAVGGYAIVLVLKVLTNLVWNIESTREVVPGLAKVMKDRVVSVPQLLCTEKVVKSIKGFKPGSNG